MAEQDLRARFPVAELRLNDEQLLIIERFGVRRAFSDGQVLVEAGAPAPEFLCGSVGRSGCRRVLPWKTADRLAGRPR